MYQMIPDVEDLFHLNSITLKDSFNLASSGLWKSNPRLGEFFSYFITSNHIFTISIIHCIGMIVLLLSIYRFAIGKWPKLNTHSSITLLLITLFFFTLSPLPRWWLDTLNWCYPFAFLFILLSETELFITETHISKIKFVIMIILTMLTCISNEMLALSTPVLLLSLNIITVCTRKQLIKSKKYWILIVCAIISTTCFLSPPCWEYRASLLGSSISPLQLVFNMAKIERYCQLPFFFYHLSRITCLVFAIFIAMLIFSKNVRVHWKNKKVLIRFAALLFLAFAMLMLCVMIPGYAPHREYRGLQFALICVNTFVLYHLWHCTKGKVIFISTLLASTIFCSKHIYKDFMAGISLQNVWIKLNQTALSNKINDGILVLTHDEWIDILLQSKIYENKPNHINPNTLLIKTNILTNKSFEHKEAVWGDYNIYYTEETSTSLYKTGYIPFSEIKNGSPDIILNRAAAQKIGLKGIVILVEKSETKRQYNQ